MKKNLHTSIFLLILVFITTRMSFGCPIDSGAPFKLKSTQPLDLEIPHLVQQLEGVLEGKTPEELTFDDFKKYAIQKGIKLNEIDPIRLVSSFARIKYRALLETYMTGNDSYKSWLSYPTFVSSKEQEDGIEQYTKSASKELGKAILAAAHENGLQAQAFEDKNGDEPIYVVRLKHDLSGKADMPFLHEIIRKPKKSETLDAIGLYVHMDVVPADKEKWRLINSDGEIVKDLSPFSGEKIESDELRRLGAVDWKGELLRGDRIYGRGAEDNKSAIAAAILAMAAIKKSKIKPGRDFYLIIDTTEESTWSSMFAFRDKYRMPKIGIGLDAKYPTATAEKGYGDFSAYFEEVISTGFQHTVTGVTGGKSTSAIPLESKITIQPASMDFKSFNSPKNDLLEEIKKAVDDFKSKQMSCDGKRKFDVVLSTNDESEITITFIGKPKSAYLPEEAVNPVTRAYKFLAENYKNLGLQPNHYIQAAHYVNDLFGLDYQGRGLGVYGYDKFDANGNRLSGNHSGSPVGFTGETSVTVTQSSSVKDFNFEGSIIDQGEIKNLENETEKNIVKFRGIEIKSNTRVPRSVKHNKFRNQILERLRKYSEDDEKAIDFSFNYKYGSWFEDARFIFPEATVQTILNVFNSLTGLQAKPTSFPGMTSAVYFGGVNFGNSMPGQEYTAHIPNEFKFVENLHADLQLITEMILTVGAEKKVCFAKEAGECQE